MLLAIIANMCGLKYYGYHCGDYHSIYDVGVFF